MKNLFVFAVAMLLITSCQEQEQRYFADSPETATLKAGIDAYESGNWEKWQSHFADTAKVYVNSKDGMSVADRLANLKSTTSAFSSYGFDRENEYTEMVLDKEKETWVYYWAQHNGTFAENNKQLSFPVHLAVQFIDGKIVEEHIYFDATEMSNEMSAIANMSGMDKAIQDSMNNLHQAWLDNDTELFRSYSNENLTRSTNGIQEVNNCQEYIAMVQSNHDMLSNINIVMNDMSFVGNKVHIKWTFSGKHTKDTEGLPASNNDVSIDGYAIWSFDSEGKATHEEAYFDQNGMNLQLGYALTPPEMK